MTFLSGSYNKHRTEFRLSDVNYLGQFPVGWANWNGTFRDTFRQAHNNQQSSSTPALSQVQNNFTGSPQLFNTHSRSPYYSINYMDIHDGLTLNDVYSCNGSYNSQGWPYGPSPDGTSSNYSWDQGTSNGTETGDDQRRAARTGMLFTLLSAGTPMIQGGDEYLRTLDCNNNAFNVDSYGNWLTYSSSWSVAQSNFNTFAQRAIAFRRAHAALRPPSFYTSSQITWYEPSGVVATSAYLNNTNGANYAIAYLLNGSANSDINTIYVAYNGYSGSVAFTIPTPPSGANWCRVTDTCNWNETANGANVFLAPGSEQLLSPQSSYGQCAESALLLIAK